MKASIPKGTRDFGPSEMAERNYIFETIRSVYKSYGYQQIETPAIENLSTLLGKYGDEGDKLLFRILNSGDPFSKIQLEDFKKDEAYNAESLSRAICDRGLRYDLTVPFARFVVQHQNEIVFPFKRYQIQTVWRADRPQKGRYREFYQCDADVIGSKSLINEVELVQIIDKVFNLLDINVAIKINNRKILSALAEITDSKDKLIDITVAIDKLEKIGLDAVKTELQNKGLSNEAISTLEPILTLSGSNEEKLKTMYELMNGNNSLNKTSDIGLEGINELKSLFSLISQSNIRNTVEIDLSLARGLNYYTGAIFEVKALDFEIGSICGGGRYDNLTGLYGLEGLSGVGISFGADRIYDVLKGLNKFPKDLHSSTSLLFANIDDEAISYLLPVVSELRNAGVNCEIYPDKNKIKKQFDYAEKKSIPFISIIGSNEISSNIINIKNLNSGIQESFAKEDISSIIHFLLNK